MKVGKIRGLGGYGMQHRWTHPDIVSLVDLSSAGGKEGWLTEIKE